MTQSPLVSVIVIFARGEPEPCLGSLLSQEGVDFEIVAVLPSGSATFGLPEDERVRPLEVGDVNPALRRNLAAAEARGQYLAFIDDDASAPRDWLKKGVELMRDRGCSGVGGPNLAFPGASLLEGLTDVVLSAPFIGAGSRAYGGGGRPAPARPGEVHLVNFMVKKEWFDRAGGFNEELGYGGEDTEFMHAAVGLGAEFFFEPSLFVYHRRRAFGPAYIRQRFRLRTRSGVLFLAYPGLYARNASFIAALAGPPAAALLLLFIPALREQALIYLAVAYAGAGVVLSHRGWRGRPLLGVLAPAAFFIHHLVYLFGLWWGLAKSLLAGPRRVRRRIRNARERRGNGQ